MNRLSIILVLLSVVSLFSCKKIECPEKAEMRLQNVNVEFVASYSNNIKNAVITADYTYPGPLGEMKLLVSSSSDMTYPASYSVTANGKSLTGTATSLRVGNSYYFCIRYYDGIGYNYTEKWISTVE